MCGRREGREHAYRDAGGTPAGMQVVEPSLEQRPRAESGTETEDAEALRIVAIASSHLIALCLARHKMIRTLQAVQLRFLG